MSQRANLPRILPKGGVVLARTLPHALQNGVRTHQFVREVRAHCRKTPIIPFVASNHVLSVVSRLPPPTPPLYRTAVLVSRPSR